MNKRDPLGDGLERPREGETHLTNLSLLSRLFIFVQSFYDDEFLMILIETSLGIDGWTSQHALTGIKLLNDFY